MLFALLCQFEGVKPTEALDFFVSVIHGYMNDGVGHLNKEEQSVLCKLTLPHVSHRRLHCRVHSYTASCEWLDAIQVWFKDDGNGGCVAKARCSSTGVFPVTMPLAPLINTLLFFAPFHDGVRKLLFSPCWAFFLLRRGLKAVSRFWCCISSSFGSLCPVRAAVYGKAKAQRHQKGSGQNGQRVKRREGPNSAAGGSCVELKAVLCCCVLRSEMARRPLF